MKEDQYRGLLSRRRNYNASRPIILNEVENNDSTFRSFDEHVAKDKNLEAQYSKSRLNNKKIYPPKMNYKTILQNNKKSSQKTNNNNKLKKSSSIHRSRKDDKNLRNNSKNNNPLIHNNISNEEGQGWTVNSITSSNKTLKQNNKNNTPHKSHHHPISKIFYADSTIENSTCEEERNQIETFDGGAGWFVSTFAEQSYVTTRIIPPTPIVIDNSTKHFSSQSNRHKLKVISDIHNQHYFQSSKKLPISPSFGISSPTDIKGEYVRKRRDELFLNRELSLRNKISLREQTHTSMAIEREQMVSKVFLRGLFAVKSVNIFQNILFIRNKRLKAIKIIQKSIKRYLRVNDITLLRSIQSESAMNKRKDVAVDLIKEILTSSRFHNKFMRGISRVKSAARILQYHAKSWLVTRFARHQVLMKLWRKLEPFSQREARRLFNIKQAKELMPCNELTPKWLIKNSVELAELRTKCLKLTNIGKTLIHENKRAELHRKHIQHHNATNSFHGDDEVQLSFLVKERTSDHVVSMECAQFLVEERNKIFEKHKLKQQTFRAKAQRQHVDDEADYSTLSKDQRNPQNMYKYLLSSPYSVVTALKTAEEARMLDKMITEQTIQNDLLSVPMGKLYIYSGIPRQAFEARILNVCSNEIEPF